ncbi:MAG: hypothetical protein V2B18_04780 [Pseudomonadota bacterium]
MPHDRKKAGAWLYYKGDTNEALGSENVELPVTYPTGTIGTYIVKFKKPFIGTGVQNKRPAYAVLLTSNAYRSEYKANNNGEIQIFLYDQQGNLKNDEFSLVVFGDLHE